MFPHSIDFSRKYITLLESAEGPFFKLCGYLLTFSYLELIMDAMKLLSGLLGNKSLSSGLGSQLLQGVLGGGSSTQQQGSGGN